MAKSIVGKIALAVCFTLTHQWTIQLPEPTIYTPRKRIEQKSEGGTATKSAKMTPKPLMRPIEKTAVSGKYDRFSITYPANKSTIETDEMGLYVTFSIDPALAKEDSIQLTVDGDILPVRINSLSFLLEKLGPGVHYLQSSILDNTGHAKKHAPVIQFMVRKADVATESDLPSKGTE